MQLTAVLCASFLVFAAASCGEVRDERPSPPPVEAPSPMGDDTLYCDGIADCPEDDPCNVWWCQPVRDEPNPDDRWGVCKLAPVVDGAACAGGAGHCVDRTCVPNR